MKKILLSLFAAFLAIGFSAFTSIDKNQTTRIFVNTGSGYVELTTPYNSSKCQTNHTEVCAYVTVEEYDELIEEDNFSYEDAADFLNSGIITVQNSNTKVYVP